MGLSFVATSSSGSTTMVYYLHSPIVNETGKFHVHQFMGNSFLLKPMSCGSRKLHFQQAFVTKKVEETAKAENEEQKPMFKLNEIGPHITDAQKQAISKLSPNLTKRCKAITRQLICFSPHKDSLSDLLASWVRIMKPRRADWLAVLKELKTMDHPFYLQVSHFSFL